MPDLQTIAALAISAVAAVYLGRQSWKLFTSGSGGCGSCSSGCGNKQPAELVQLQAGRFSEHE